jgi:hypothetical protein
MSEISKYAVNPTGRLELIDPSGEKMVAADGRQMAIVFYGPGSKEYARAQAAQSNRLTDQLKKKGKSDQTAEQKIDNNARFLTDVTHSFENIKIGDLEGKALYNALYTDLTLGFVADNSAAYLNDWVNFSKPSTNN